MKPGGLEEVAIPLWKRMKGLLPALGPPTQQVSWYVHINYSRGVPSWKILQRAVRQHLGTFRNSPVQNATPIRLFDDFVLELSRAGLVYPYHFVFGPR